LHSSQISREKAVDYIALKQTAAKGHFHMLKWVEESYMSIMSKVLAGKNMRFKAS